MWVYIGIQISSFDRLFQIVALPDLALSCIVLLEETRKFMILGNFILTADKNSYVTINICHLVNGIAVDVHLHNVDFYKIVWTYSLFVEIMTLKTLSKSVKRVVTYEPLLTIGGRMSMILAWLYIQVFPQPIDFVFVKVCALT